MTQEAPRLLLFCTYLSLEPVLPPIKLIAFEPFSFFVLLLRI